MAKFFFDAAAFPFAQADCAAFSCAAHNSMIILDASLILLASIFVLLLADLVEKKTEQTVRIAAHFLHSLPIPRTR
jgi:uncharacterized membrane protein